MKNCFKDWSQSTLEWVKILLNLCMLGHFSCFLLSAFFSESFFFQNFFFQKYHQSVNQCGSRSDLDANVCKGFQLNTLQASKFLKIDTCPASQKLLNIWEK